MYIIHRNHYVNEVHDVLLCMREITEAIQGACKCACKV